MSKSLSELTSIQVPLLLQVSQTHVAGFTEEHAGGFRTIVSALNARGNLWRWPASDEDFEGCLPVSEIAARGPRLGLGTMFKTDRLNVVPQGRPRLTKEQLRDVWCKGRFEVTSGAPEVPPHVWTINSILMRGWEPVRLQFRVGLARIYGWITFTWPQLVHRSDSLSLKEAFLEGWRSVCRLADLFFGIPQWSQLEDPDLAVTAALVKRFVSGLIPTIPVEKGKEEALPNDWTLVEGGKRTNFDFSLVVDLSKRSRLQELLRDSEREVRRLHREKQTFTGEVEDWLKLQLEVVEPLSADYPTYPAILVATTALAAAREEHRVKESEHREKLTAMARSFYPLRSLCPEWLSLHVERGLAVWREAQEKLMDGILFDHIPLHVALDRLRDKAFAFDLRCQIRLLEKELSFRSSSEPQEVYQESLSKRKLKVASRHEYIIYRPTHWKILKTKEDLFYAVKYTDHKVSASWGWRFRSWMAYTWQIGNVGCYYAMCSALYGPVGLKALIWPKTFYPAKRVNATTGELETDTGVPILSMIRRLADICGSLADSRRTFEAKPDTGLLSKGITRIFHLFYVYCIATLSTVFVLVGQPAVTLANLAVCAFTLVLPFVWAPTFSLIYWFGNILLFDTFHQRYFPLFNTCGSLLVSSAARGVLAGIGLLAVPVGAALYFVWLVLCFVLRRSYDQFMFCCLLRPRARAPGSDSFLARRTAGPGLSFTCFFQVSPAVALIAMSAKLEQLELNSYKTALLAAADKPVEEFESEIRRALLLPFGLTGKVEHDRLTGLRETRDKQRQRITHICKSRQKQLDTVSRFSNKDQVRLSAADLARTMELATALCKRFLEQRIFAHFDGVEVEKFWDSKDLAQGDWSGIARYFLSEAFSEAFVDSPLERMDADGFSMQVTHLGLDDILVAAWEGDSRAVMDPLSRVSLVNTGHVRLARTGPAVDLSCALELPPRLEWRTLVDLVRELNETAPPDS